MIKKLNLLNCYDRKKGIFFLIFWINYFKLLEFFVGLDLAPRAEPWHHCSANVETWTQNTTWSDNLRGIAYCSLWGHSGSHYWPAHVTKYVLDFWLALSDFNLAFDLTSLLPEFLMCYPYFAPGVFIWNSILFFWQFKGDHLISLFEAFYRTTYYKTEALAR